MLSDGDPDQYKGLHRSDAALRSTIPAASVQSSLKQPEQLEGGSSRRFRGLGTVKTVQALFSFRLKLFPFESWFSPALRLRSSRSPSAS